jgi:hypothetical protein
MLRDVVYYRLAFESLTSYERRRYEHISPSPDEWEKAQTLLPFLKKFYDLTEILSGTSYPTANLFIRSFCEIKIMLNGWCSSTDPTISEMANVMIVKFDKYWKKSNVALAVANVLDPRFKKRIVDFYLRKLYGNSFQVELDKFNNLLEKMYHHYAAASPSSKSTSSTAPSAAAQIIDSLDDELDNYINHNDIHGISEETTELDRYLIEPKWKVTKENENIFDVLSYWKLQKDEYPAFSKLARDVLAMQASIVASESAFSAGGRVINPYRSQLDPEMVEALVCTRDWIVGAKKGESFSLIFVLMIIWLRSYYLSIH